MFHCCCLTVFLSLRCGLFYEACIFFKSRSFTVHFLTSECPSVQHFHEGLLLRAHAHHVALYSSCWSWQGLSTWYRVWMALRERRASFFCGWKQCFLIQNVKWKNQNKIWPQSYLSFLKIKHIRNYTVINGTIKMMYFVSCIPSYCYTFNSFTDSGKH